MDENCREVTPGKSLFRQPQQLSAFILSVSLAPPATSGNLLRILSTKFLLMR